jgi:hypothetical protein
MRQQSGLRESALRKTILDAHHTPLAFWRQQGAKAALTARILGGDA